MIRPSLPAVLSTSCSSAPQRTSEEASKQQNPSFTFCNNERSRIRLGFSCTAIVMARDVFVEREKKYSNKMPSVNPGTMTGCAEVARSPLLLDFSLT